MSFPGNTFRPLLGKQESALLVIGYGNTLRRDDGVGPHIVHLLQSQNVPQLRTHVVHQLAPELADPISQVDTVVFVDACRDSENDYDLREVTPSPDLGIMRHVVRPETILALARDLFNHAPKAWVLTVKGEDFSIGEALSEVTERRALAVVEFLAAWSLQ